MNRQELQIKRALFLRELKLLDNITVECFTCQHYSSGQQCARFEAKPPADIIKTGCDEWLHDPVPF